MRLLAAHPINPWGRFGPWRAGCFQSVVSSFFLYALKVGEAIIVVPVTALYPGVTLLLGVFVLGEEIAMRQLIGVGCAIAGVILISV